MRFWRRLSSGIDRVNNVMGGFIRWLALVMVLIGAYNALARYATRYTGWTLSSNALFETQWYLFSVIFLLGAAYGLNHDVHVRVDVLYSRLSERGQAWIDLLGTVLFLLPFCLLMLYVSWPAVRNSWVILETSPDPGGLPRYPIKALILVSFALLLLQGVSQLVKSVDRIRAAPAAGPGSGAPEREVEPAAADPGPDEAGEEDRRDSGTHGPDYRGV